MLSYTVIALVAVLMASMAMKSTTSPVAKVKTTIQANVEARKVLLDEY